MRIILFPLTTFIGAVCLGCNHNSPVKAIEKRKNSISQVHVIDRVEKKTDSLNYTIEIDSVIREIGEEEREDKNKLLIYFMSYFKDDSVNIYLNGKLALKRKIDFADEDKTDRCYSVFLNRLDTMKVLGVQINGHNIIDISLDAKRHIPAIYYLRKKKMVFVRFFNQRLTFG